MHSVPHVWARFHYRALPGGTSDPSSGACEQNSPAACLAAKGKWRQEGLAPHEHLGDSLCDELRPPLRNNAQALLHLCHSHGTSVPFTVPGAITRNGQHTLLPLLKMDVLGTLSLGGDERAKA